MAATSNEQLPIVDFKDLQTDRAKFLGDLRHALANVGFLILANAPGFSDEFQQRMFREVRAFFDAPLEVKMKAHISKSPYFRGYTEPIEATEKRLAKIELFQYGFEKTPIAEPSDESVPLYDRIFRGPNTWPETDDVPGFQPAIEELTVAYHKLMHEVGHLVMECLGEDPVQFERIFDFNDPALGASLNKNWGMDDVRSDLWEKTVAAFAALKSDSVGSHIDKHPFMALLINDRPGLQVVGNDNRWINAPVTCRTAPGDYCVPVIPGAVVANTGGTLMHLSRGRCPATLHRVNTTLVPSSDTRISMPYFLLPRMDIPLIPFGDAAHDTGFIENRNRGLDVAVERMGTFPAVTKRWWMTEFRKYRKIQEAAASKETDAAYQLAEERAKRKIQQEGFVAKL